MRRCKVPLLIAILVPIALAALWLASTSRAATETPAYKVIRRDGKFEIRDYPALTLASTTMRGDGGNGGFSRLFRFISGGNERSEKIAMTTPVLIGAADDAGTMSFIMPKEAVERGVPKPAGESVALGRVGAARYAVLGFGGGRTARNEAAAIEELTAWMDGRKIARESGPIFAYYDPPWTPVFLRRNELLFRIGVK